MTISNGYRKLSCPSCGTFYGTPGYISINYSAREYWSDGRMVDCLAPIEKDLAKCNCGAVFLLSEIDLGPLVYNPLPLPPANWETEELPSYLLAKGETSRDFYLRHYDFRTEKERAEEEKLRPQILPTVENREISGLLCRNDLSKNVVIELRRRYWRYLNDDYREKYKKYKKNESLVGYPDFILTTEQENNLKALLLLLEDSPKPQYLEIAEIYRELGMFKLANEIYVFKYLDENRDVGDPAEIGEKILYGINYPFIFDGFFTRTKNIF